MSEHRRIDDRITKLTASVSLNAVERSRKLKSLQVTKNKLLSNIQQCDKKIRLAEHDKSLYQDQLKKVEDETASLLKQNDGNPIVTEHAMLRYVERHMGIDLSNVVDEIIKLPLKETVVSGNTIVTVFKDPDDHFNLAERESS